MDIVIPCETIARLSAVLDKFSDQADAGFRSFRLDNGLIVVSNRKLLAVERVGQWNGVFHLIADPALIDVCQKERAFDSKLTITIVPELSYATAKTMFGYIHPENCLLWAPPPSDLDRWREVAMHAKSPALASVGTVYVDFDLCEMLVRSSPSGRIVFEEKIDTGRMMVVRDVNSEEWFGMFWPRFGGNENYPGAKLPDWVTP